MSPKSCKRHSWVEITLPFLCHSMSLNSEVLCGQGGIQTSHRCGPPRVTSSLVAPAGVDPNQILLELRVNWRSTMLWQMWWCKLDSSVSRTILNSFRVSSRKSVPSQSHEEFVSDANPVEGIVWRIKFITFIPPKGLEFFSAFPKL